ncbi:MAG: hypothetical protein RLY87_155 [Chloroflexota bacterium]
MGRICRHKAIHIGTPRMFVDTGAVYAGRDRGMEWGHNGIGPPALQRRPTAHRAAEAIVDDAFSFAGGIDDEGVDFEEGGYAQEPCGNHPSAGEVVIAFDNHIGAEVPRETQNRNERHE